VDTPKPVPAKKLEQLAQARDKFQAQTAHRAVDDPVVLNRAARIVRAALARQKLTLADLPPLPDPADGPDHE
jgi:hypothetical protein